MINVSVICAGSDHLENERPNRNKHQCKACLDYNGKHRGVNRTIDHSVIEFRNCDSYAAILRQVINCTDYPIDPIQYN